MRLASKLFIGYILVILSTVICQAQSKDAIIKDIKSSFQLINQDQTLKVIKLENEEFLQNVTDGGGILIGYFKNNDLCKIKLWIGLSYGVREFEYYLKNDLVSFIYEKENDFKYNSNTGTIEDNKPILAFEGRYYLNKEKVIEVTTKGNKRFEENPNPKYIYSLLSDVKPYKKLLQTRLNKPKL